MIIPSLHHAPWPERFQKLGLLRCHFIEARGVDCNRPLRFTGCNSFAQKIAEPRTLQPAIGAAAPLKLAPPTRKGRPILGCFEAPIHRHSILRNQPPGLHRLPRRLRDLQQRRAFRRFANDLLPQHLLLRRIQQNRTALVRPISQPLAPSPVEKSIQRQNVRTIPHLVSARHFHSVKLPCQHSCQTAAGGENGGAILKRAENLLVHVLS